MGGTWQGGRVGLLQRVTNLVAKFVMQVDDINSDNIRL